VRYEWAAGGVILGDGREVARVASSRWRARGEITIGPVVWRYAYRHGEYVATRAPDVEPLYRARHRSLLSFTWDVTGGTHRVELRPRGLSTALDLLRDGAPVGRIEPARRFGVFRPVLDIEPGVPLEEARFVMWVARVMKNHGGSD
jgi:hypothetical protein